MKETWFDLLATKGGMIVSSNNLTIEEIELAKKEDRFYVNDDSFGFAYMPPLIGDGSTIGEQRVRIKFNPSGSDIVDKIKNKAAELINLTHSLHDEDLKIGNANDEPNVLKRFNPEKPRLISLSMTGFEEGAMWAVKAATYKEQ